MKKNITTSCLVLLSLFILSGCSKIYIALGDKNMEQLQYVKAAKNYEKAVDDIKKSAITMAWYMRGGVSYEDVLNMSTVERQQINELIESNLETTKKSQMPFF